MTISPAAFVKKIFRRGLIVAVMIWKMPDFLCSYRRKNAIYRVLYRYPAEIANSCNFVPVLSVSLTNNRKNSL